MRFSPRNGTIKETGVERAEWRGSEGLEKGGEEIGRWKREKWRRCVCLCFESRECDGITDLFSTLTRYFFFLTCPHMQTIERGLQVVDF